MKILLDTDIGGDIDDALALAYLLKQPHCELLGITTVGGESEKRAALASAICHAAGRAAVPVHVGASAPLLVPERQPHAYQSEALTDQWPHQTFDKRNTALEFLRDTIRAHPSEITLLTIGPLTNIGLLFALDPDIPALLKGLMMMGGCFSAKKPDEEWNIVCDPHAAAKVFAAPLELTSVGFDVTGQCRLDAEECRRRFTQAGGPFTFVAVMAEVFFRSEAPEIIFHDPLAAALIFEPSLWVFGSAVEATFGHVCAAAIFLFFAAGSAAAEYAFFEGGVGLSGVGYGLFGLLWILSRTDDRFRDAVDAQTVGLFIAWFFLCIVLTASGIWAVGNVAHGMGAAQGVLLGFALEARRAKHLVIASLAGLMLVVFVAATVGRPSSSRPDLSLCQIDSSGTGRLVGRGNPDIRTGSSEALPRFPTTGRPGANSGSDGLAGNQDG